MVATVQHPDLDPVAIFETVYQERERYLDFYSAIYDDWKAQVERYISVQGNPEQISPLLLTNYTNGNLDIAEARKKSLINLYTPKEHKTPYVELNDLRNNKLLFCPSCGEDGNPETLDHYLPKDKYPEFSTLVSNLTPMCFECQLKKKTAYLDENGLRIYIHPYFDNINQPLFKLNIMPPYQSPNDFVLEMNNALDADISALAARHSTGVNLFERFCDFCEEKYIHILKLMAEEREDEEPLSAQRLFSKFLRLAEKKAINNWDAIFYRSVIQNNDLLAYLDNEALPEYM